MGAGPIWLGLDSAVKAAAELGNRRDATVWRYRRERLGRGIERLLFDGEDEFYGKRSRPGFPEQLWPIAFHGYDHPRMQSHAERAWENASRSLAEPDAGELSSGQYEPKFWLGLSKAWKGDERSNARIVLSGAFENVQRQRAEPRETGPYRVVGDVNPRQFLGDDGSPVTTARIEIGFQSRTSDPYEYCWSNWIEPERSLLVGWYQDSTHDDLGAVHLQVSDGHWLSTINGHSSSTRTRLMSRHSDSNRFTMQSLPSSGSRAVLSDSIRLPP